MAERVVVLLSGGLDSTTVLALAQAAGCEVYAMSFAYGQRHETELRQARMVAAAAGVREHRVVEIDLRAFGGSALTDDLEVPKGRDLDEDEGEIPITYVPARNTIFLSYALAWAEVLEAAAIYIGVNALDYSGYPDCRPEYIDAYQRMARLATRVGVDDVTELEIRTPLLHWTKARIIREGLDLGVDYALTISCYDPDAEGRACGACDACQLRLRGFEEIGERDPARYVPEVGVE